jgi:hypothetical protein
MAPMSPPKLVYLCFFTSIIYALRTAIINEMRSSSTSSDARRHKRLANEGKKQPQVNTSHARVLKTSKQSTKADDKAKEQVRCSDKRKQLVLSILKVRNFCSEISGFYFKRVFHVVTHSTLKKRECEFLNKPGDQKIPPSPIRKYEQISAFERYVINNLVRKVKTVSCAANLENGDKRLGIFTAIN